MKRANPERIGVRAFRENLSSYLRRVQEGEAFEVTDRGSPVARLARVPDDDDPLDRLIAEGRARPAKVRAFDLELPPDDPDPELSAALARALDEQRADTV